MVEQLCKYTKKKNHWIVHFKGDNNIVLNYISIQKQNKKWWIFISKIKASILLIISCSLAGSLRWNNYHVMSCPLREATWQQPANNIQQGTQALCPTTAEILESWREHRVGDWEQTLPSAALVSDGSPSVKTQERCWTVPGFFIHRNGDVTNVSCCKPKINK